MKFKLKAIFLILILIFSVSISKEAYSATDWVHILPAKNAKKLIKKASYGNEFYTGFGEIFIVSGGPAFSEKISRNEKVTSIPVLPSEKLYLITSKETEVLNKNFSDAKVVWRGAKFVVILANETAYMGIKALSSAFTKVEPLPKNQILLTPQRLPHKLKVQDKISKFLDQIDMKAFLKDLQDMVSVKTRYSYVKGSQTSMNNCEKVFKELGLTTKQLPFKISSKTSCNNLEATIKGSDEEKYGQVLIMGHLDSISKNPTQDAPGADDNGTGSAGVIALARLVKKLNITPKATLKFILFSGEEQGLYGSKAYVKGLSSNEMSKIKVALNMDMIGFERTPPLSLLLETSKSCKYLAEKMEALAQKYTNLAIQTSLSPWGSDHVPFLTKQIPSTLSIESEFSANPNYHQVTDLIKDVNLDLCEHTMRLNAAAMYIYGIDPE